MNSLALDRLYKYSVEKYQCNIAATIAVSGV